MSRIMSAIDSVNLLIDGAMPDEARKNPNRTATIDGPPLREPDLIMMTRMIPNSSTADSEMATTDHTLGRSRLTREHRATNEPFHAAS